MKTPVTLLATLALALTAAAGCGGLQKRKMPQDPAPAARAGELLDLYATVLTEADALKDPATGWLTSDDCDGFLWSVGKLATAPSVHPVNVTASEDQDHPGRFGRRPAPCWTRDDGDVGSKSTWSRDMGLGLVRYAMVKRDRALLARHIAYGEGHSYLVDGFPVWKMGDPENKLRTVYTPSLVGLAYRVDNVLGGPDRLARWIPNWYPDGLDDYQAHLQVMFIETTGLTMGITTEMEERLARHVAEEPASPYYAYVQGLFSGDLAPAVDRCLAPGRPVGGYARCDAGHCETAEWLSACGATLKRLGLVE